MASPPRSPSNELPRAGARQVRSERERRSVSFEHASREPLRADNVSGAWPAEATRAYPHDVPFTMPLRLAELQDRLRAAMLGFAIGDALGFPMRGLPPPGLMRLSHIADDFPARPRGRFAKGQFSDDTQMMLAVAESVAQEKRIEGRSIATHLSWLWQEGVILQPPTSATQAAQALLAGTPWMGAGAELGVRDPSCLSRGLVLGFWCEDSPTRLAHDAHVVTVVTHKDPLCTAAVATFARAIQLGLSGEPIDPAAMCEALSKAAAPAHQEFAEELYYLPRALAWSPDRALPALRRVGVSASEYDLEAGLPAHVTPVLLTALYCVLKSSFDVRASLTMALGCGGEVDVAAAVVGAIAGAFLGTEGLPARLRRNVLYAEALVDGADRLFDAKLSRDQVSLSQTVTVRR